jgi:hypothetical protein
MPCKPTTCMFVSLRTSSLSYDLSECLLFPHSSLSLL